MGLYEMILESSFWKEPLLRSASYLNHLRMSDRTSERTLVRIEKEVFVGFYAARKLLEAFKVSDKTKDSTFNLTWHPALRRVDLHNWHDLDRNYDLAKLHTEKRDIMFLCNQFIHSYVFIPTRCCGLSAIRRPHRSRPLDCRMSGRWELVH